MSSSVDKYYENLEHEKKFGKQTPKFNFIAWLKDFVSDLIFKIKMRK